MPKDRQRLVRARTAEAMGEQALMRLSASSRQNEEQVLWNDVRLQWMSELAELTVTTYA